MLYPCVVRATIVIATVIASAAPAGAQTRTVVLSGAAAPGVESGAVFSSFPNSAAAQLSLDSAGQAAFLGRMLVGSGGVTSDTDAAIWSEAAGSLELVAREGSQAPGVSRGGAFAEFARYPLLNDNGQVAFPALLRTGVGGVTADNNSGVWAQRDGGMDLVAREGEQAPGAPPAASFSSFTANMSSEGFIAFNNQGRTAFTASLAVGSGGVTTTNDTGIWAETASGLTLMAREGVAAPGTAVGAVFDDLTTPSDSPVLNHQGQLAFSAQLRTGAGGVTSGNDFGIWIADEGELSLAIREGASAPVPAGATFRHFGEVHINDRGSLMFRGLLNIGPGDVTAANDEAIWLRRGDAITLVAREGGQVPGAPAGANYGAFSFAALNNHDRAALSGYLQVGAGGVTADNNSAIWSGPAGDVQLAARENDQAPGAQDGVFSDFFTPNINTAGQVAFMASLKPSIGGVTSASDRGIWATDVTGALRLIAREGDLLEVAPGDVRTIAQLGFRSNSGNADGRYSMFNDFGQVLFWAEFAGGGEGAFVSDLVRRNPSPADFDENGVVNGDDLAAWNDGFGTVEMATHAEGDADGDQHVDGRDLLAWQQHLGSAGTPQTITAIPEPSAWALATICGALHIFGRRRAQRPSVKNP
ncbi:MAG TPA: choice-of-anchor tandem repeat NxxGxxAF-containing protein [Lacipirellula sp.]